MGKTLRMDARSWNEHRLLFLGRGVSELNLEPEGGGDGRSGTNTGGLPQGVLLKMKKKPTQWRSCQSPHCIWT